MYGIVSVEVKCVCVWLVIYCRSAPANSLLHSANSHDTVILHFSIVNLVKCTIVNGPQCAHFTKKLFTTIVWQTLQNQNFNE